MANEITELLDRSKATQAQASRAEGELSAVDAQMQEGLKTLEKMGLSPTQGAEQVEAMRTQLRLNTARLEQILDELEALLRGAPAPV